MMNELLALTNLLTVQKIKQIDIITETDSTTMSGRLLKAIREDRISTDEEAMQFLYPDLENPNIPYTKLKYRLKQRLLNTLFFTDIQQYSRSPVEKARIRAYKNWAAGEILYNKGVLPVARALLESQLKTCLKYDFLELSLPIIQHQKYKYGLFKYDKKKYKKYKELYKVIKHKYDLKIQVQDIYIELANNIRRTKILSYNEEIKLLESELTELMPAVEEADEYYTRYFAYNSLYFLGLIKQDISQQAVICEKALSYFKTKNGFTKLGLFSFSQKKGLASLALKKYDKAIEDFDDCFQYNPPEGAISWQYLYGYKFLTYILKYDYSKAYETTSLIMNHKAFKKVREDFKQNWFIKEAFIHFLVRIGKIVPSSIDTKPLRKFRVARFLNEVSDISQDKKGINISINILQLLFLVLDKKYDAVLDKINALKQYSFRHLKQDRHIRPRTFIKMLQKIPVGDYNPSDIVKKTQKLYTVLMENPMSYTEDQMQLEIIPYEQMWRELLVAFDQNKI